MHRISLIVSIVALAAAAPMGAQQLGPSKVPEGHKPPPGMCRIWIDGVPPGRQSAPTDCATAVRNRPSNGRVIWGDDDRTREADSRQRTDDRDRPQSGGDRDRPRSTEDAEGGRAPTSEPRGTQGIERPRDTRGEERPRESEERPRREPKEAAESPRPRETRETPRRQPDDPPRATPTRKPDDDSKSRRSEERRVGKGGTA